MANFIVDQKGRLLTTVFPAVRGDAALGSQEVIEVSVDLSQIGSGTSLAGLGVQTTLPNSGTGLAAADSIDVAVLPYNFQVQSVHFILDTNMPTPDVVAQPTTLSVATFNIGDAAVLNSDRSTAATITGYTPSATAYATGQAATANASALVYTTGTRFLPYAVPAASGTLTTAAAAYVLRLTVNTLTGATRITGGKFRIRVAGIIYGA